MGKKASEIFLALFHQVSLEQMERGDFIECAEAWAEIRDMEDTRERTEQFFEDLKKHVKTFNIPEMGDAPEKPEEIRIDQHTFASEADVEAEIEAMKEEGTPDQPAEPTASPQGEAKEEKPVTWTDQQKAIKARKIQILERLRRARENHVSGPTIAKAAGVDDTKVYAVLNAGQVTIQTYEKISAGLEKLGY